jgi:hypothetical protein
LFFDSFTACGTQPISKNLSAKFGPSYAIQKICVRERADLRLSATDLAEMADKRAISTPLCGKNNQMI